MAQVTDFSFMAAFMAKRPDFIAKTPVVPTFLVMKLAFSAQQADLDFTAKEAGLTVTAQKPSITFEKLDC